MSDVEMLRRAATLMRKRAEAATPGPWAFTDSEVVDDVWIAGMIVVGSERDPIANLLDEWYENDPGEPAPLNDAEHIAGLDPLVALALADLIDETAKDRIRTPPRVYRAALVVARAYLGDK